jgi:hypothetical protein
VGYCVTAARLAQFAAHATGADRAACLRLRDGLAGFGAATPVDVAAGADVAPCTGVHAHANPQQLPRRGRLSLPEGDDSLSETSQSRMPHSVSFAVGPETGPVCPPTGQFSRVSFGLRSDVGYDCRGFLKLRLPSLEHVALEAQYGARSDGE